jgi:hypothetical protein
VSVRLILKLPTAPFSAGQTAVTFMWLVQLTPIKKKKLSFLAKETNGNQ